MSKSIWYSKQTLPSETVTNSRGRIIRPAIERWMPRWAAARDNESDSAASVETECRFSTVAEYQTSMEQLRCKSQQSESAKKQCIDSLSRVADRLAVKVNQRNLVLERLHVVGDTVPKLGQQQLTMLQESYLNVSTAVNTLQTQHDAVTSKLEQLSNQLENTAIELAQQTNELQLLEDRLCNSDDDLRHAA